MSAKTFRFLNGSIISLFDIHTHLISKTFRKPKILCLTERIKIMMFKREKAYHRFENTFYNTTIKKIEKIYQVSHR